jgi:8-oxo-dGTP pyrophosphatase MutT (NUDIX family)
MTKKGELLKVQVWVFCEGKVLILKTNSKRGGFWQPVTGAVESGESFEDAALREAQEETGLDFISVPRFIDYEFSFDGRRGPARERAFFLEAPKKALSPDAILLDSSEHSEACWVSPQQALSMLKFESNAKALEILIRDHLLINQRSKNGRHH